jgi:hypothetical protein
MESVSARRVAVSSTDWLDGGRGMRIKLQLLGMETKRLEQLTALSSE